MPESRRCSTAGAKRAKVRRRSSESASRNCSEEIEGHEAQQQAKAREIEPVQKELSRCRRCSRRTSCRRASAGNAARGRPPHGERAQLIASAAQAKGKIAEIELQMIQLDQDLKTEVMKDLREIQAKQAELNERRVAAEDQLRSGSMSAAPRPALCTR